MRIGARPTAVSHPQLSAIPPPRRVAALAKITRFRVIHAGHTDVAEASAGAFVNDPSIVWPPSSLNSPETDPRNDIWLLVAFIR
jgi:hypothetical protein